jgi:hypothetical protein
MPPVRRFDQALNVAITPLSAREKSFNSYFQGTDGYTVYRQKQTRLQV